MAAAHGSTATALGRSGWQELLAERPSAFDLLFALRIVECAHPELPRLGSASRPSAEPVRLSHPPSLSFPASTVVGWSQREGVAPVLESQFLGVFGPNGPLPLHLTEYAAQRKRHDQDGTFAAFADLFHHRMLTLFYRAWAAAQPTVQADRPAQDAFARYVGALIGLGLKVTQNRDLLPDAFKLYHAGHYVSGTRHADGLCAMVRAYFGVGATLQEFVGEWVAMPAGEGFTLGQAAAHTACLGRSTVIGTRVYMLQHRFRLTLGPLTLAEFRRFQQDGASLRALVAMVRGYAGLELSWELRLILGRGERPEWTVGQQGRLGRSTWLAGRSQLLRGDELTFDPEAVMSRPGRSAQQHANMATAV